MLALGPRWLRNWKEAAFELFVRSGLSAARRAGPVHPPCFEEGKTERLPLDPNLLAGQWGGLSSKRLANQLRDLIEKTRTRAMFVHQTLQHRQSAMHVELLVRTPSHSQPSCDATNLADAKQPRKATKVP